MMATTTKATRRCRLRYEPPRQDAGPAPVGRLAAPVKAQSTRKKYWRKLVDDLAPRDAPLKFVWPNPKAHLTSKSFERRPSV